MAHAAPRRITPQLSLRRQSHAARLTLAAGLGGWPQAHQDADEADGNRGHLSQTKHLETRARPQDLSVFAARYGGHTTQPSLGHGPALHPHGAGLHLSGSGGGLVESGGCWLGLVSLGGGFVLAWW